MYDKDTDDFNMMDNPNEGGSSFEFADDMPINPGEPEIQTESIEDLDQLINNSAVLEETENVQPDEAPIDKPQKNNKNSGKLVFPLTIVLLGILLLGSLTFIFGEDIPFVANVIQKVKGDKPQKIKESDVQNIDIENIAEGTSAEGTEEVDDELAKILKETSIDTGISVDNKSSNNQMGNMPNPNIPQRPGMNGEEEYPELPGVKDNQEIASVNMYNPNVGRMDPFNPSGGANQLFDIVVPPTNPTPDTDAQKLLTLRISGIMYTPESPSAIINIAGQDQLVRKGDKFNGFSVERITKDKVTVKNGSNTYTASVGEIFNIDNVGVNGIPNLNKKFAGPYSKGKDTIIEINNLK